MRFVASSGKICVANLWKSFSWFKRYLEIQTDRQTLTSHRWRSHLYFRWGCSAPYFFSICEYIWTFWGQYTTYGISPYRVQFIL